MPKHVSPKEMALALKRWRVPKVIFESGWDDPAIDPYGKGFQPVGVILHHTAGIDSRAYIKRGSFPPVRNSQFLIGRRGEIFVMAGAGCYHAGSGGAMTVGGFPIAKDAGNRYLYGIEIESLGKSPRVTDKPSDRNGMTPQQVRATALLTAALLDLIGQDVDAVIRHRDWAPRRKIDVLQPLSFWRREIKAARRQTWDGVVPPQKSATHTPADTVRLQARLFDLGFRPIPAKEANPRYPKTAIMAAQATWGLPANGKLNKRTWGHLFGGVQR